MLKKLGSITAVSRGARGRSESCSSEKGFVLVIVLVLSAVSLLIITALIYMITRGTQISGLQKQYKTALDAGVGGGNVLYQFIGTREDNTKLTTLDSSLDAAGLVYSTTTPGLCSGTSSAAFGSKTYTGLQAKLMTSSTTWNANCNKSLNINPADSSTYDMKIQLGTTPKYNVYAKIVATTEGNTGDEMGLWGKGVTSASTGELPVFSKPFLYAIEVVSENDARVDERAKLSVLYEY